MDRLAAQFDPSQPFDPALFVRLREQLGYGEYAAFWDGKEWWGTDMPIGRDRTPTWLWLDEAISHWAFGVPGHRDLIIDYLITAGRVKKAPPIDRASSITRREEKSGPRDL